MQESEENSENLKATGKSEGKGPIQINQCFGTKTAIRMMKGRYVNKDTTAMILHLLLHDFASAKQD